MPQPTPWTPRGGLSATCLPVAALQPQRQCHCVVVCWDAAAVQLTTVSPLHHITAIDRKHPHAHLLCLKLFLWTLVQYPPPTLQTLVFNSQSRFTSEDCRSLLPPSLPDPAPHRGYLILALCRGSRPCSVGLAALSSGRSAAWRPLRQYVNPGGSHGKSTLASPVARGAHEDGVRSQRKLLTVYFSFFSN